MAWGRDIGSAGVESDPGGAPPQVGVGGQVASPPRPPLPHGLFPEKAHVLGRDHAE
jgi:hypothetical protein